MEMSILIFNNYTGFKEIMEPLLEGEGIKIISVSDYDELEIRIRNGNVQLLLLDLELSSAGWCSGIEMISEIRGLSSLPMIIISGQTAETAKIMALDSGADDYVTQEVNPLVLLARIKSQIRRYTKLINVSENIGSIYRVDGLEINDDTREVSVEGRHVRLTPIEYKILSLLVKERGRALSIDNIYESVWHMRAVGADNTIAVHIRHIREKIESNPKEPRYLKVVWGTGYKVG